MVYSVAAGAASATAAGGAKGAKTVAELAKKLDIDIYTLKDGLGIVEKG